jgi:hypothetical protein
MNFPNRSFFKTLDCVSRLFSSQTSLEVEKHEGQYLLSILSNCLESKYSLTTVNLLDNMESAFFCFGKRAEASLAKYRTPFPAIVEGQFFSSRNLFTGKQSDCPALAYTAVETMQGYATIEPECSNSKWIICSACEDCIEVTHHLLAWQLGLHPWLTYFINPSASRKSKNSASVFADD